MKDILILNAESESGYSLILLNIFMFFITCIVLVLVLHPSLMPYNPQTPSTQRPIINNNHNLILPLPVKNEFVSGFSLVFSYETVIKELRNTPAGTEIVTDVQDRYHPPFLIDKTQKTYILFKNGNELRPADLTDLKPGQNVQLETYFEVNTSKWYLPEVYILE